ncbi:MAG TPA: hypothetical protein PLN07_08115 [Myxococcota bacterium]|nr:hypothetical protein [Myxococcota bacterium]
MVSRFFSLSFLLIAALVIGCGGGGTPTVGDEGVGGDRTDISSSDNDSRDRPGDKDSLDPKADSTDDDVSGDVTSNDTGRDTGRDTVGPVPDEPCVPGTACDDFDPCTYDDTCNEDGECVGTLSEFCDDEIDCTDDYCEGPLETDCHHEPYPGWCFVDGHCYKEGAVDPFNPCMACITAAYQDRLVPDDTLFCDDGNACTVNDRCIGGACVGSFMVCDDNNPCTTDMCVDGVCVYEPLEGPCNDNDICTENDMCIEGECVGELVICDDQNPCTDDSCDPFFGCLFIPNNIACDDGNVCTVGDQCFDGVCQPGNTILSCDDGNPCTDDICSPDIPGGCLNMPNSKPCDDGDPCTIGDYCEDKVCQPGKTPLLCDSGNPCLDDVCEPGVGCMTHFNNAPCDDLEPCFLDDYCLFGECQPGPTPLVCDDDNICTDDFCLPMVGCQFAPNSDPCDDDNVCTRFDTCVAGVCVGEPVLDGCDDDDECTTDFCIPNGDQAGCGHTAAFFCRPHIVIDWPPRAATLMPDPETGRQLLVTGHIETYSDFLGYWININGQEMMTDPRDGHFWSAEIDPDTGEETGETLHGYRMIAQQGMNPIYADAKHMKSLNPGPEQQYYSSFTDHLVQSYYFSSKWYPVDHANPQNSMVFDGFKMFLGKEVWDDNDTSTPNDIATILTLFAENLDIGSLIQNPVASGKKGWCKYKVNIRDIRYGRPAIDLIPIHGGLALSVIIPNFRVKIDVPTSGVLCPSFSGRASASSIIIAANVMLSIDGNGEPVANLQNPRVTINGLDISLDGIWGFLLNWIIDFFEDRFARMIEDEFRKVLAPDVAAAVQNAIKGLALDMEFTVPGFLPGSSAVPMRIKTKFSTLDFRPDGGVIGMSATVLTDKNVNNSTVLGSIGRASCFGPQEPPLEMPRIGELELGLHDDFLNFIPFALWYGGGLQFDIDPSMLEGAADQMAQFGMANLALSIEFKLPPILSACNPSGALMMQMGDVAIRVSLTMAGRPLEMLLYTTLSAEARLVVETTPEGVRQLGLQLDPPLLIDVQIAEMDGGLESSGDTMTRLIREMLMPMIVAQLSGRTLASFPIPEIDLHAISDQMPVGSKIAIDLKSIIRQTGNTVVSGDVM